MPDDRTTPKTPKPNASPPSQQAKQHRAIHGQSKLAGLLVEAGIVPDNCTRIIIDIAFDRIVEVYYRVYGDERLLEIDWGQVGAIIREEKEQT